MQPAPTNAVYIVKNTCPKVPYRKTFTYVLKRVRARVGINGVQGIFYGH